MKELKWKSFGEQIEAIKEAGLPGGKVDSRLIYDEECIADKDGGIKIKLSLISMILIKIAYLILYIKRDLYSA